MLMAVGKGFSIFGSGSLGIRLSGEMFSFFFFIRGHKYRSKQRWKRSWIRRS